MFGGFLWYSCTSTLIQEEIEDTKEVIRIVYRKKTDNTMAKRKKHKRTNNDLQNTTQKTKDRVTRTPLKTGMNSGAPEMQAVPVPLVTPVKDVIK